ncbi:MAG: DUF4376 domain-containing protein [Betaproteobacteria bacterium]
MFYASSTGGFYHPAIHGDNIPADAVEITDERHAELLLGESQGKLIVADEHGHPQLQDAPVPPLATRQESAWERIKTERDRRTQLAGYQVNGHWFHSDTFSRTQQIALVIMGPNMPPGIQWKTMSGEMVTMTPTLAGQIFAAAAASDIAIYTAAEAHRAAMLASANPDTYNFSGGWPPAFQG